MHRSLFIRTLPLSVMVLLGGLWLARAGDLNPPPGPVSDTYPGLGFKTLQQVEPRTPVEKLSGSATALYQITASGSYYLTGNITAQPGKHAIEIAADNVTLDLNGFLVVGAFEFGTSGVAVASGSSPYNIAVHNGTVRDWGAAGLDLVNAANSRADRLRVTNCYGGGIVLGNGAGVADCHTENTGGAGIAVGDVSAIRGSTAQFNGNGGIRAGAQAAVSGCVANSNSGGGVIVSVSSTIDNSIARSNYQGKGSAPGFDLDDSCTIVGCSADINNGDGIAAGSGCTVSSCSSRSNFGSGIISYDDISVTDSSVTANNGIGIWVNGGSIINCTVSRNGWKGISSFFQTLSVVNCEVSHNGGEGVFLDAGGRVAGCTVTDNGDDGIEVGDDSVLSDNKCSANGTFGAGAGIYATGTRNRIEGNAVTNQDAGIDVDLAGSLVIGNSASNNTLNYDIAAGNTVGAIVSTEAAMNAAANSHVNIEF